MSKPVIKFNDVDFTNWVSWDGLEGSKNDLDADGSGRNVLDGFMYRHRIGTKNKYGVPFIRLPAVVMASLETTLYSSGDYVKITMLEAMVNRPVSKTYYFSTINEGIQRYIDGDTVYDGVMLEVTER